jgi:hypothetical protein
MNTTTVTVNRIVDPNPDTDGYDANQPSARQIETDVRAAVVPPSGTVRLIGGTRVIYSATLQCDVCDIQPQDTITDEQTMLDWTVLWVTQINALGFDHMHAQLRRVEGASSG